jgi:hypothetical protein
MSRTHRLAAALVLLALAALGLAACGGSDDSPQTFESDDYPFTFEYPGDWQDTTDVQLNGVSGSTSSSNNRGLVIDENNGIFLSTYTTTKAISADNIEVAQNALEKLLSQVDPNVKGTTGAIGGFPSVSLSPIELTDPEGAVQTSFALFDGTSEYFISCQATSDHTDEVDSACKQMQSTLEKTSSDSGQ